MMGSLPPSPFYRNSSDSYSEQPRDNCLGNVKGTGCIAAEQARAFRKLKSEYVPG